MGALGRKLKRVLRTWDFVHSIGPWRSTETKIQAIVAPSYSFAPRWRADFGNSLYYDANGTRDQRKCLIRLCTLMAH
jgi:hypothetical protein